MYCSNSTRIETLAQITLLHISHTHFFLSFGNALDGLSAEAGKKERENSD